jgi:hypothetical protein
VGDVTNRTVHFAEQLRQRVRPGQRRHGDGLNNRLRNTRKRHALPGRTDGCPATALPGPQRKALYIALHCGGNRGLRKST